MIKEDEVAHNMKLKEVALLYQKRFLMIDDYIKSGRDDKAFSVDLSNYYVHTYV